MLKMACTHDNIKTVHKELNQPTTKENERRGNQYETEHNL